MFKKTIKYVNFNGDEVEKDFYFHISKAELIEMGVDNSMKERIARIVASNDGPKILEEFKAIIKMSVGVRSEDGETFDKSPEAQTKLMSSPAYDELLVELATNATAATEFIKNLLPEKMQKELMKQLGASDPFVEQEDVRPAWEREHRNPTDVELRNMSPEELRRAFQKKLGM